MSDPGKTLGHNLAIRLATLPTFVLTNRPRNLSAHNLCTFRTPPANYRTLLGLGLNFCVQPKYTSGPKEFATCATRFRRDIYTQMCFADKDDDWDPNQLFIRSDWEPNPDDIPIEFRARVSHFLRTLATQFRRRKVSSNLPRHHEYLLQSLRDNKEFIVIPSDKNLGPCIIEYISYIRRVFVDHLCDTTTYERIDEDAATLAVDSTYEQIDNFLLTFGPILSKDDVIYLNRSIEVDDPFAYFYITAKIHKRPWKTRPIVSVAGSLTHGLGRWVDQQLQPLCRLLPSYLKSSLELKTQLQALTLDTPRVRFFTADASAMYTNIDTDHALEKIATFLRTSPLCTGAPTEAIIQALTIIMRRNYFKFGDTAWLQTTGTAMGTPPGCVYATLYFGIWEMEILPLFENCLPYYRRYIDDCFGVWQCHPDAAIDAANWMAFQASMDSYGKLEWTFTERAIQANFLDLSLKLTPAGITTSIFEKAMNLYLYLPPHSAHPPGVLRGLIIGMTKRIFRLTTTNADKKAAIHTFFQRLVARGYRPETIRPILSDAVLRASTEPTAPIESIWFEKRIFLHLPYNPKDVPSKCLQRIFRSTLLEPPGEPPLPTMVSAKGAPIKTNRMIVAYHRPLNLKNLLFPRRFPTRFDCLPSQILSKLPHG